MLQLRHMQLVIYTNQLQHEEQMCLRCVCLLLQE